MQFGRSLRFVGTTSGTEPKIVGDLSKLRAMAYFTSKELGGGEETICGVATIGKDPQASAASELFRRG